MCSVIDGRWVGQRSYLTQHDLLVELRYTYTERTTEHNKESHTECTSTQCYIHVHVHVATRVHKNLIKSHRKSIIP